MAAETRTHDGWVVVPYDGPNLARVEVGVTVGETILYQPAFLDFDEHGRRVAKVRPLDFAPYSQVWLKVNGNSTRAGRT